MTIPDKCWCCCFVVSPLSLLILLYQIVDILKEEEKTVWYGKIFSSSEFLSIPSRLRKDCPASMKCHKGYNNLLKYRQGKTMQKRIKNCLDTRKQRCNIFLISCYPSINVCLFFQSTGFPNYWCYPLPVFLHWFTFFWVSPLFFISCTGFPLISLYS